LYSATAALRGQCPHHRHFEGFTKSSQYQMAHLGPWAEYEFTAAAHQVFFSGASSAPVSSSGTQFGAWTCSVVSAGNLEVHNKSKLLR